MVLFLPPLLLKSEDFFLPPALPPRVHGKSKYYRYRTQRVQFSIYLLPLDRITLPSSCFLRRKLRRFITTTASLSIVRSIGPRSIMQIPEDRPYNGLSLGYVGRGWLNSA
jgi:hypothetical protein